MGKIVAIGGGQYGQPRFDGSGSFPYETLKIDREIVKLSGKKHPVMTFVPTASGDSREYVASLTDYFERKHGVKVRPLYVLDGLSTKQMRSVALSSDIVYVGGGNTLRMMRAWRRVGLDVILKEAYEADVVLAGVSAGAGCWFESIFSDSWRQPDIFSPVKEEAPYIFVRGLGLLDGVLVPHFDEEPVRREQLKERLVGRGVAIGLEKSVALEIVDGKYRVLAEHDGCAYRLFWAGGNFRKAPVEKLRSFSDLKGLLYKK